MYPVLQWQETRKFLKASDYSNIYGYVDEELRARAKTPTETGEQQHETKIFLWLLQKCIICPGLGTEREFATEIQETEAQVLHTIKILLGTFMCEISVMQ